MKKVWLGIVLACFTVAASAAQSQSPSVRVGPSSEETATDLPAVAKKEEELASNKTGAASKSDDRKNDKDGKGVDPIKVAAERVSNKTPNAAPPLTSDAAGRTGERPAAHVASQKNTLSAKKDSSAEGNAASPPGSNTTTAPGSPASPNTNSPSPPPAPTSIYRVGVGDVLDVHLSNVATRDSTLYTVMAGGLIDYPLAGDPFNVAGLTTEEVGVRIAAELRRRAVYDQPQVLVSVREYVSHTVLVSGLVYDPGVKILRREAVPLYVLIAEAQPKPEAGRALVMLHSKGQSRSIDLSDTQGLNTLIHPSDVVNLVARPQEYFYIGGEIGAPGQKDFHPGMTLTQGLLASGGITRAASGAVRVSRQRADGRLVSTTHDLRLIQDGKVPDPALQPGDRIEVEGKKK